MKARVILAACAAVLLGACGGADGPEPRTGGAPLRELVERARAEAGLPGLAAVVVEDGAIDAASSGSRIACWWAIPCRWGRRPRRPRPC